MKAPSLVLGIVLFLMPFVMNGQAKVSPARFVSLGTTPLNALDPITGTLETVLEVKPLRNLSGELKYGRRIEFLESIASNRSNKGHSEWKTGLKFFLGSFNGTIDSSSFIASINPFIGIEHFRLNHRYENSDGWLVRNGKDFRYDSSNVNRKVRGFRFRMGVAYFLDQNWGVEAYAGMGIKRIDIDHDTVNEREEDRLLRGFTLIGPDDHQEGRVRKFDFILGFKVDYRFFTW